MQIRGAQIMWQKIDFKLIFQLKGMKGAFSWMRLCAGG